ncbi:DUF551 domain-containing protein [Salmonella enterica subsp. enterica serovar Montevideo]|nr:DUF551 domain-containing protein [Salmonella enterica subsp. enterica serovar Montevideo]
MTITKERLLKIQHWRETYGADSNVMLPAEEAEDLARIALASLEAEKGADPVVFTDERNLHHIARGRETSLIWGKQNQEVGDIPLYRHAQPVPVVPEDISGIIERFQYQADHLSEWHHIDEHSCKVNRRDLVTALEFMNSCRAAMLQGAEPVSQTYKLNELSGNSPVTPDGWISCSERMPDSKTGVLVAREFGRKGDWRMKWGTYIPGHPDAQDGWIIPGASWLPTHWMPLPEPPQEEK